VIFQTLVGITGLSVAFLAGLISQRFYRQDEIDNWVKLAHDLDRENTRLVNLLDATRGAAQKGSRV
jgi:hypothetical protein